MTDHANELRRHARKIPHPQGETPGVMLRAADEIERLQRVIASPYSMTRDDVIRMAREAGLLIPSFRIDGGLALGACTVPDFERFASLGAAAEREACAAKMDAIAHRCRMEDSDCEPFVYAAFAIRSRGNQ